MLSSPTGVIGLGVMGKLHARVYNELGILTAVCDVNPIVAEQVGKLYNVPWYSDYSDMFKIGLRAVTIATPTPSHLPVALACLDAGMNILLEKPIASNLDDAEKIVTSADAKGLLLAIGYIEMYNPAFRAINHLVHSGELGKITSVTIRRIGGISRSADNVILDLMTHDIGLSMELFGQKPSEVSVHQHIAPANGIVNSAQGLFKFGEASATCEANWVSPVKVRQMSVVSTNGYCEVDLIAQKLTIYRSNPSSMFSAEDHRQALINSDPYYVSSLGFKAEPLKEELSTFIEALDCPSYRDRVVSGHKGLEILDTTITAVISGSRSS